MSIPLDFTESTEDELIEDLQHEYEEAAKDNLGETSFDHDARMVHATLLAKQNQLLQKISDHLLNLTVVIAGKS